MAAVTGVETETALAAVCLYEGARVLHVCVERALAW